MTEGPVKEYKKRSDTILAIQWQGSLDEVPGISNWVLEQDPNANVNAKFTSSGLAISIQTNGLLLAINKDDYVVVTDKGLQAIGQAAFLNMYEAV